MPPVLQIARASLRQVRRVASHIDVHYAINNKLCIP
jgi:hypothetical protein